MGPVQYALNGQTIFSSSSSFQGFYEPIFPSLHFVQQDTNRLVIRARLVMAPLSSNIILDRLPVQART